MDPGYTMTLDQLKAWHKTIINSMRDDKITGGYTAPTGIKWGTSPIDIQNLTGVCVLVMCGAATSNMTWRDYNNIDHDMSPSDLVGLAAQLGIFVQTMYHVSWQHKANVDACTTISQLLAYDITTGW